MSPSQRKIENYFQRLRGGPTGLSMRSKSPKPTQGTIKSPLEGVLEVGALAETSRPGTGPLPVERGGAASSKEKGLESQGLGEVASSVAEDSRSGPLRAWSPSLRGALRT